MWNKSVSGFSYSLKACVSFLWKGLKVKLAEGCVWHSPALSVMFAQSEGETWNEWLTKFTGCVTFSRFQFGSFGLSRMCLSEDLISDQFL